MLALIVFTPFFSIPAEAVDDSCEEGGSIDSVSIKSDTGWTVDVDSTTDMDLRVDVTGTCTLNNWLQWRDQTTGIGTGWGMIPSDDTDIDCTGVSCRQYQPDQDTWYEQTITCVAADDYSVAGWYFGSSETVISEIKTLSCESAVVPEFDAFTLAVALIVSIAFIAVTSRLRKK